MGRLEIPGEETNPTESAATEPIGFFRHLVRGCGTLPHCGEHPGTVFLLGVVLLGAVAGASGGWKGILGGAGIMFATFGPIYLCGAYRRSTFEEASCRP